MNKDPREWAKGVAAARPAMIEMALRLQQPGVVVALNEELRNIRDSIPFIAIFSYEGGAETTIFFQLMDSQTESDVVITNMTTLPREARSRGFGSRAVQTLLVWAKEHSLQEIRATQAADPDGYRFWLKNGFVKASEPNPCKDLIYKQ